MYKYNKIVLTILFFAIVVAVIMSGYKKMYYKDNKKSNNKDILSDKQIDVLREEYPLVSGSMAMADFAPKTFYEVIDESPAVVNAKVVEELPKYELPISEPDGDGFYFVDFYPYKMELLNTLTNNGMINEEDKYFTLLISSVMMESYPEIKVGDEGIFPVIKGKNEHENEYIIYIDTYYYVTEDDYVLSAYTEDEEYTYTGNTKEFLTDEIESINNKCCKSKIEKAMDISVPDSIEIEKCNVEDDKVETVFYVETKDLQQLKGELDKSEKIKDKVNYVQENDKVKVIIDEN